jgi:hypothetical protein
MMMSENSTPFNDLAMGGDLSKLQLEPSSSMGGPFSDDTFFKSSRKSSSFGDDDLKLNKAPYPANVVSQSDGMDLDGGDDKDVFATKLDVLCGRDKLSHAHSGNKRFRKIIEKHREEYQTAQNRESKTSITTKIIQLIESSGGRFLKKDDDTDKWEVVTEAYAKEKVSHALRSAKDPNRPKVKKRRVIPKYIPTPREEEIFQAALRDQQRIFKSLVSKERQGVLEEALSQSLNDSSEFLGLDSMF